MQGARDWVEEFPAKIIVTAADGTILSLNRRALESLAADGGAGLIGQNVLDCHPEPARSRTEQLYREKTANHYTIRKNGQKKVIHQMPWYENGVFAGVVELSIPIPDELPHFDRDKT
jgi:transcriptional regulator with PAS, ATPase and Fis domain